MAREVGGSRTMNDHPMILFHMPCLDGFAAAWATWKKFADKAEYIPVDYGQQPPDVTGRDVIIVDFSYKRSVLSQLSQKAHSVLLLDHHKSSAADLIGLPDVDRDYRHFRKRVRDAKPAGWGNVGCLFDMARSGARLSWDYFHPGAEPPQLIQVVEDHDLWRFALPNTRELVAAIRSYAWEFEVWDKLYAMLQDDSSRQLLLFEGRAIDRRLMKDLRELVAQVRRREKIGDQEVWVANVPKVMSSDAGNMLAAGEPFAATYCDYPEYREYSLRSVAPDGVDVSEIAHKWGGGGHRHAAGFKVPLPPAS